MFDIFEALFQPRPDAEAMNSLMELSEEALEEGLSQRQLVLLLVNFAVGAGYLVLTPEELRTAIDHALEREARDVGRPGDRMAVFKREISLDAAEASERCAFQSSDGWRCKRAVHDDDRHDFIDSAQTK